MRFPIIETVAHAQVKIMSMLRLTALLAWVATGGVAWAAGPMYWDWPADQGFNELELAGASLDADGRLGTGLSVLATGSPPTAATDETAAPDGIEIFWRAVSDGQGGAFIATGHGGVILHVGRDGARRTVCRLEATEVFALLRLADGGLLAGCGPEGTLFRIDPAGQVSAVGTVPGGYIWDLAQAAPDGPVWLATGSPAALYRFDPAAGSLTLAAELPAQNALAVRAEPGGTVLVGTQGPGLMYRHESGRQPRLLFETPQSEIRRIIDGPQGGLFCLAIEPTTERNPGPKDEGEDIGQPQTVTMPSSQIAGAVAEVPESALYRVAADGRVESAWTGSVQLLTAAWSPHWGWLGGGSLTQSTGQAELHLLTPPAGTGVGARWAGGDVLDLLVTGDEVLVFQAHPGEVTRLGEDRGQAPAAVSAPLDGGSVVAWGRLHWRADGDGEHLRWSVRGGNRSVPDDSWTPWSKAWSDPDQRLPLPPSRFLQWRVEFGGSGESRAGLRVTGVSVSAWQDNLPPVVTEFQLEHLADMGFGGMMNGSENITQRFRSGLMAEFSRQIVDNKTVGPARSAFVRPLRVFSWRASDPNGDRISYGLEYRRVGTEPWHAISLQRPGVLQTSETLATWDTSDVPDGSYELRLTASDRPDNPADLALTAARSLGPLAVDNTAPVISDFQVRETADGFAVRCRAEDVAGVLAGAQLLLPDGTSERLDPSDRICDSRREEFDVQIRWPPSDQPAGPRPWPVRIQVQDLAGNVATATGEVR